jgi:tetratricopeptide (TPR) repeat protein
MSAHIEKAQLLIGQDRFDLAIKELKGELLSSPDEPHVHALLAVCLRQLDRNKEALEAARRAVQVGPDYAYAHYVLAGVYDQDDRFKEAEQAIREAIRLDPEDADYYARLASLHLQQRRWEEGLRAAERALELDPTHPTGLNLRTMALNSLDRTDDAAAATRSALAANPEDATAHASQGWQELRGGNPRTAMTHFREALRLDSSHAWAREGVVEALKARNPIYRAMLGYFLWTSRLQPRVLWGFIIGGFVLSKVLRDFVKTDPQWAPYVWLVLGPYFAFVLMTWIAEPLFNLLLRTDPIGRVALTPRQTMAANWFGGSLLLALLSLAIWLVVKTDPPLVLAVVAGLMVIPISSALATESGRARKILMTYAWALGLCGTFLVGASFVPGAQAIAAIPFAVFLLGVAAFFWVASWIKLRFT